MPEARKPNAKQLEAIETTEGPVLITAGPGTGKTYTLVQRAMYLIKEKKVKSPRGILMTTFTNKAAGELITRLTDETEKLGIPFNVRDMYIGTFHSICGRILRENVEATRLRPNFKILDGFGQKQLVLRNMARLKLLPGTGKIIGRQGTAVLLEQHWADAKKICDFVNTLEEEMVDVEELKKDDNPDIVECAEVLEEYRQILREGNMIDFSESQTECYRLLKDNKRIRDDLGIKYLMIDEYQDTNYVQERLVLLLGGKDKNICVVGDDDQSLYRFRGATVSNILGFSDTVTKKEDAEDDGEEEKDKKECVTINLEENYRSNDRIVEFYNKWMEDTAERRKFGFYWKPDKGKPYRHLKSIVPQKEKDKEKKGESVIRISGRTEEEWHKNVLDFLQGLFKSGAVKDANQVAFLFESLKDEKVTGLADYLEENGIRVYAPRSNMFFERDEIKLAIGCLILMSPAYQAYQSADTVVRRGKKGLHEYYRECLEKVKDTEIGKFAAGQDIEGLSFPDLLYRLLGQEPFRSMMDTDVSASAAEIRPERNMAIFSDEVAVFESLYGDEKDAAKKASKFFEEYLRLRYKDGVGEYEYDEEYAPKGCVSFLTFHQAKGMEYPIVFVGTLDVRLKTEEEKAAEKTKKKKPELIWAIEKDYFHGEKREPYKMIRFFDLWRKYYTAFSRAQDLLVLTCSENYNDGRTAPHRIFEGPFRELPTEKDLHTGKEDGIKFSATNKTNLKKTFSFTSDIALYDRCPLLYKFRQEIGFKSLRQDSTRETTLGTLVHETIEKIHKAVKKGEEWLMTDEAIKKWLDESYADFSTSDEFVELSEKDREKALRQVLNYAHSMDGKWAVEDAEADIMLPEGNYIIEGIVDLIEKSAGDTLEIVDFKTSERKPDVGSPAYNKNKKQLQVYAYLVEKHYGKKVKRMHLHYTNEDKDPLVTFDYNEKDVKETMDAFRKTAEKIMAKDFSGPVTSPGLCRKCDFRFYCKK